VNRCLARGVLAEAGLEDAAHDALVYFCRCNAGTPHRLAHRKRAQLRR
jgi:hypothetical protein